MSSAFGTVIFSDIELKACDAFSLVFIIFSFNVNVWLVSLSNIETRIVVANCICSRFLGVSVIGI